MPASSGPDLGEAALSAGAGSRSSADVSSVQAAAQGPGVSAAEAQARPLPNDAVVLVASDGSSGSQHAPQQQEQEQAALLASREVARLVAAARAQGVPLVPVLLLNMASAPAGSEQPVPAMRDALARACGVAVSDVCTMYVSGGDEGQKLQSVLQAAVVGSATRAGGEGIYVMQRSKL